MKAFNIVATAALFSATFSWAKKLDDKDTDFADKFNDALTKEVEHNLNTLYDGTFQTEIGQVKICGN